jgi:hypothetical protein
MAARPGAPWTPRGVEFGASAVISFGAKSPAITALAARGDGSILKRGRLESLLRHRRI